MILKKFTVLVENKIGTFLKQLISCSKISLIQKLKVCVGQNFFEVFDTKNKYGNFILEIFLN